MSGYLLDTSILSELSPDRRRSAGGLGTWLQANRDTLYIPALAATEIEQGIARLRRAGGAQRADRLAAWLDRLAETFGSRVLPIDFAVAHRAGAISDAARANGNHPGLADVLIAATASVHGLTVATRNTRHFRPLPVNSLDPFEEFGADGR